MVKFDMIEYDNPNKHYTDVKAWFDRDGNIIPLSMTYDGDEYEVDKITDIRPAASLKSGGAGIRYTCMVEGKPTYLFLEDTKWFYELVQ